MNREDIIRMAFEASGGMLSYDAEGRWTLNEQEVIRLATLVAAAEREACAKVCEDNVRTWSHPGILTRAECAAAIRARGEQEDEA